MKNKIINKIAF